MEVPIFTPFTTIAIFLVISVVFLPVGVYLMNQSASVVEQKIRYDGLNSLPILSDSCKIVQQGTSKTCYITFEIEKTMEAPVYLYYELGNFFQNHRSYARSRSSVQLRGINLLPDSFCDPLSHSVISEKPLNPCGLIANSFFTDKFELYSFNNSNIDDGSSEPVLNETGIAWQTDREYRFKQPEGFKKSLCVNSTCEECLGGITGTCNTTLFNGETWAYWYPDDDEIDYLYEIYPDNISPILGVEDEHFIVWMRTASLSTFEKLYGFIDRTLEKGSTVQFKVESSFYVAGFDGHKALVLSTTSEVGGYNPFLGPLYLVVGGVALLIAVYFAAMSKRKRFVKIRYQHSNEPLMLEIDLSHRR